MKRIWLSRFHWKQANSWSLFQWKQSEEVVEKSLQEIREELADAFIYSFMLADNLNLDVEEIIKSKLDINSKKYPVELSKGNNEKIYGLGEKMSSIRITRSYRNRLFKSNV